jgi:small GTP-binding protein
MRGKILQPQQQEALSKLRSLLLDLHSALVTFGAAPEDESAVRESQLQLDSLFLLVVAGEFNAGKSAFINALLGERILEEGVTPTTSRIQVVRFGAAIQSTASDAISDEITAPVELLREIHIVDTPGTNAIERHHEAITQKFLPRADIVFFLTSADRPLTESERVFLSQIREWGKKIVIVLNKIDILESDSDLERILAFIKENIQRLLGFIPEIFPVAARPALQAKRAGNAEGIVESRFDKLEEYIAATLDEQERVRLKLLNPLGVGARITGKYLKETQDRADLLKGDGQTIEQIERELKVYQADMTKGFQLRLADVDNILHEFEKRGDDFFESTIRLSRIFDLTDKAKIKASFEKRVITDLPKQIEQRIHEIIDWLVTSDLQQWQIVRDHLTRRRSEQADRLAGQMTAGFQYDRSRLLDSVGKTTQRTLENYDKETEASRMAESLQEAVGRMAIVGVGAVGLGTAVSILATTAAADVTGLVAAGAIAAFGLLILPHRKQVARKQLHEKIAGMRTQLIIALTGQFDKEVQSSVRRVEDAIAPYTRFIKAEHAKLDEARQKFEQLQGELVTQSAALSEKPQTILAAKP